MKTKTLIFLLPRFSSGGAERIVITIANALCVRYEVYLAVIQPKGPLITEINTRVHVIALGSKIIWPLLLIQLIRKQDPVAVMSTFWDLNLILVGLRFLFHRDTRLILREAVIPHTVLEQRPARRFMYALYRHAYPQADQIIALSENMKQSILDIAPDCENRISVVNNAISPERLNFTLVEEREFLAQPYLIAIGRLIPQKGFDMLIEAFAKCQTKLPMFQLIIVGEGKQRAELEQLIRQWGLTSKVKLTGHIKNPVPMIKKAHLYILSSRFEGMPNTLVESLCVGTPVLATTKNTSAEEFITPGINGYLVEKCDSKLIAKKLNQVIPSIESLDRQKIAATACKQFALDTMIDRYEEILIKIG